MPKTHKSNRSLAKRIKITGTGKVLKRKPGQNHFNAKDSGSAGLQKRGQKHSPISYAKSFQKLLPSRRISSEQ
ncbi:MAG: 50S ribosomal protein L35 [Candidatus Yanofskybacteria bacterium]|nr:50S ribosomal protein L35 [Candidatus Yanofskybacteria bacterium]